MSLFEFSQLTQIIATIGGVMLAFYTLVVNKNLVFKNTLQNQQIEELGHLREILFEIWFDVYFVKQWADNLKSLNRSLIEFEKEQPDSWTQYLRFKRNSLEIFYKLDSKDYYLIPSWIEFSRFEALRKEMGQMAPFTVHALMHKTNDEIKEWQRLLLDAMHLIDVALSKKAGSFLWRSFLWLRKVFKKA